MTLREASGEVRSEKVVKLTYKFLFIVQNARRLALLIADSTVMVPSFSVGGILCLLGVSEWYRDQNCLGE